MTSVSIPVKYHNSKKTSQTQQKSEVAIKTVKRKQKSIS